MLLAFANMVSAGRSPLVLLNESFPNPVIDPAWTYSDSCEGDFEGLKPQKFILSRGNYPEALNDQERGLFAPSDKAYYIASRSFSDLQYLS